MNYYLGKGRFFAKQFRVTELTVCIDQSLLVDHKTGDININKYNFQIQAHRRQA